MENTTTKRFITDYFNNVLADNDRVFQVHLDLDQIKILMM